MLDRARQREAQDLDIERLDDEVVRADADRGHGGIHAAERGDHHDRHVRSIRDHALAQREAIHALHVEVGDHDIEVLLVEQLQRFERGRLPCHDEAAPGHRLGEGLRGALVVVDDEDVAAHAECLRSRGPRQNATYGAMVADAFALSPALEFRNIVLRTEAPQQHDACHGSSRELCRITEPRQIDREHAADARRVADMNHAVVDLDAPRADLEPEPQARAIARSLLEWAKQILGLARRQATALILDVDQHAIVGHARTQDHVAVGVRELERVLQQIRDDRLEDLSIGVHGRVGRIRHDRELDAARVRLERGGALDVLDELGDDNLSRW